MVGPGVKGRPQACITCSRRKKGCDLQRPSCGQCRKSCIPCGGYNRGPKRSGSTSNSSTNVGNNEKQNTPAPPYGTPAHTTVAPAVTPQTLGPIDDPPPAFYPPSQSQLLHTDTDFSPVATGVDFSSVFALLPKDPIVTSVATCHPLLPTISTAQLPPSPISVPSASTTLVLPTLLCSPVIPSPPSSECLPLDPYDPYELSPNSYPGPLIDEYLPSQDDEQSQRFRERARHAHKIRQRITQYREYQTATTDLMTSLPVSRSADETRIIGSFWEAYLPNGKPFPPGQAQIDLGGSINNIIEQAYTSHTIYKALVAMALTTIGSGNPGVAWMRKEGHRIYGDALQDLSQSFERGGKWTADQLQTTRLFAIYEAFHGADAQSHLEHRRSWMVHSGGDVALLTSKPPDAYTIGNPHLLFVAGRHHLALSSLMTRKRCFLAHKNWKTIPWSRHEKTPRDHLLDILVDLPAIFEAIDAVQTWTDRPKKSAYLRLVRRAVGTFMDRMINWHDEHFHRLDEFPLTLDDELPEVITTGQLAAAHVMSLYWSMCLRVIGIQQSLRDEQQNENSSSVKEEETTKCNTANDDDDGYEGYDEAIEQQYENYPDPEAEDPRIDADACSSNIVCTIRIFTHRSAGMFRQHITPFPMSTALQHLILAGPAKLRREREVLLQEFNRPECALVRLFITSIEPLVLDMLEKSVQESN